MADAAAAAAAVASTEHDVGGVVRSQGTFGLGRERRGGMVAVLFRWIVGIMPTAGSFLVEN